MNTSESDIANLSYEQARDELATVVAKLESGTGTLAESLTLWERGEALADHCQEAIDAARTRLAAAKENSTATQEGEPS